MKLGWWKNTAGR